MMLIIIVRSPFSSALQLVDYVVLCAAHKASVAGNKDSYTIRTEIDMIMKK